MDTPASNRARPLAELSLEDLVERRGELARRWAVALVLRLPVERIGEVPLEDVALEGPALCAQTLLALQSDVELARLTGSDRAHGRQSAAPARRLARVAGARDPSAVVEAVEALRGVLWETLAAKLADPALARLLADAGDRLAAVCAALAGAALAALEPAASQAVAVAAEPPLARAQARPVAAATSALGDAVIVDEDQGRRETGAGRRERDAGRGEGGAGRREGDAGRREGDAGRREKDAIAGAPPALAAADEIAIHDVRGGEGPKAWLGAIGRCLERFASDGRPFSVLLVEARASHHVEELLQGELCRAGVASGSEPDPPALTREHSGRWWLLAHGLDRGGGQELADRLAAAAGARGEACAIGVASCPQDGTQAATLAAHADVGLYAARAALRTARPRAAPAIVDRPDASY